MESKRAGEKGVVYVEGAGGLKEELCRERRGERGGGLEREMKGIKKKIEIKSSRDGMVGEKGGVNRERQDVGRGDME